MMTRKPDVVGLRADDAGIATSGDSVGERNASENRATGGSGPVGPDELPTLGEVLSLAAPAGVASPRGIGTPWGPLRILEEIGGGAFGKVYRAWDPSLDHEVALKRLRLSTTLPVPEAGALIVREGQLLARVRHPNVVTVHGACEVAGEIGIWMELVRGKTLKQLVEDDGPMSAAEATLVAESLCGALAAIHHAGLIHRDIKAGNVMREAGGRIVMLDLGAGTEIESELAGGGSLTGTLIYMAPELFDGRPASIQSDIYALGILLFYLVTGSYPVQGRSVDELRAAHHAGRRRLLLDVRPDLPRSFVQVVERAIAATPADRYESAGAVLRDLAPAPLIPIGTDHRIRNLVVAAVAAGVVGPWAIGLLGSLAFNVTISRVGAFRSEPLLSYWVFGVQSLIPLVAQMLFLLLFAAVLRVVALPLRRVLGLLGRGVGRMRTAPSASRQDGAGSNINLLAQLLLVAEVVLIALLVWRFRIILGAVTTPILGATPESLEPLRPANGIERGLFTLAIAWSTLGLSIAWIALLRHRRESAEPIGIATPAAGVALIILLVSAFLIGYRTIYMNKFERVRFESTRCYMIGERTSEVLLYCPDVTPPRNIVVSSGDPRLQRLHVIESIFTPPE